MKIADSLKEGTNILASVGIPNAYGEIRELLTFVTGKSKEWLATYPDAEITENEYCEFMELLKRRECGEPLQYILGYAYFMGLPFSVNENVLIPRADTEILVEHVVERVGHLQTGKILDMCTGCGCIGISLKKYLKNFEIFASDISENALLVARRNAEKNGIDVKWIHSDCFEKIPNMKFDGIVSNPPYITKEELTHLQREVTYEPLLALDGGLDGLDFYKTISKNARDYLKNGGILAFEIGYQQGKAVTVLLETLGYREIEIIKDYSGNERVVIAKWYAGGIHESD